MAPTLPPSPRLAKLAAHILKGWRNLHPHTKGKWAENLAYAYLILKGYAPAPRPLRALAQTDLLLTKHNVLALVEVKARTSESRAHLALTPAQKARLARAATQLAARHPNLTVRIDLLLLFPHLPFVRHIKHIA